MVDLRFVNSLQIMMSLAKSYAGEELLTSSQLAVGVKAHPAFVRRMLVPLSDAGLIKTYRGKVGGVRLARNPKQINLRQIYEAAVDSNLVARPEKFNSACPVGSCMDKVFADVSEGMEAASLKFLESVALDKLLAQVKR